AKEHNSIDAHKARNALCFMRIPFGCRICKFNCKFGFKFKKHCRSNLICNATIYKYFEAIFRVARLKFCAG
ncbi:hypothetical protein, partial [Campylobacter showae]